MNFFKMPSFIRTDFSGSIPSSSTDNEPNDPSEIPSSIAVTDSCAIFSFNLFSNGVVPLSI